uniref:Uncharacterized protein MANES_02G055500 n=1 Tax=Rhizophora mucronata TaxID=61149 RepID=A0A2P2K6V9_RHIMU
MAMQAASNSASPSAQMVGNAFVEQYYHILHNSPKLVYRFYQDSSVISRPEANGEMTSVATMQGINEKILSLNFMDYKAEIKTADAQKSFDEGVIVLVTGCLTGKDNLRRRFAQSFFLAPQDNGYFVLNDVFRYIEENDQLENCPDNGVDNIAAIPSTTESDPSYVSKPPAPDPITSAVEENKFVTESAKIPLDTEKQLVKEKEAAVESYSGANWDDCCVVGDSTSATQEDTPKKSYASIVKVAKGDLGLTKIYVPTNTTRVAPKKPEMQIVAVAPPPEHAASVPSGTDNLESSSAQEEGEGHSIYIRNLPLNMMPSQLEEEFKKFGPIKPGGIQVRYKKVGLKHF